MISFDLYFTSIYVGIKTFIPIKWPRRNTVTRWYSITIHFVTPQNAIVLLRCNAGILNKINKTKTLDERLTKSVMD